MKTIFLQKTSFQKAQLKSYHTVKYESEPRIIEQENQCSIQTLLSAIKKEPSIILTLFELSFYEKILGDKNKVNKDLYFKTDDFFNYERIISPLFKKSVVSLVQLDNQEKLYQVTVCRITSFGHTMIQLLQDVPQELQQLYCSDCQLDKESDEGLYTLSLSSTKDLHGTSQTFNNLITHSNIKSIDVTCLTLPQLCESQIPKYLLTTYNELYLSISIYPKTDIRLKRLLWEK